MKLIIGIKNPGKEFENTPHNAGAFVLKQWAKNQKMADFEFNKKLQAEISQNNGFNICLLSNTYMNESGSPISKLVKHFKIKTDDLLISHDDSDLILGKYKIQHNRGSAGHKGIESIVKSLKTKKFWRLRVGIRPTKEKSRKKAGDFVLKKFSKRELGIIEELIPSISLDIYSWLS